MFTIAELIARGQELLKESSPTPRLDAEVLLAHVLGATRLALIRDSDKNIEEDRELLYFSLLKRRETHEPIAYIVGRQEFYGREFLVTPDVLIPRPETELLIDSALKLMSDMESPIRILDLGTGSGCIAVTLSLELKRMNKEYSILAIDKSSEALAVAQKNAKMVSAGQVEFRESSWFSNVDRSEEFDVIVSNPPYIAPDDINVSQGIRFEPKQALYSQNQGLSDIECIVQNSLRHGRGLKALLIECGYDQGARIMDLVSNELGDALGKQWTVSIEQDLAGLDRLLVLKRYST